MTVQICLLMEQAAREGSCSGLAVWRHTVIVSSDVGSGGVLVDVPDGGTGNRQWRQGANAMTKLFLTEPEL